MNTPNRVHDLSTALRQGMPLCFPGKIHDYSCPQLPSSIQNEVGNYLPLRVIDIGDEVRSQRLRLHITERNERGFYATLSYRWGSKVPLRTTQRTLKRHMQSLEFQNLPQTFQDAIRVTRLLGIRYLWIDSLCIIQDDHQDWLNQAAEMGSIYQHSLVTIAVHSAQNSSEGFLWRRTVPDVLEISPRSPCPAFWLRIPPLSDQAISIGLQEAKSQIGRGLFRSYVSRNGLYTLWKIT